MRDNANVITAMETIVFSINLRLTTLYEINSRGRLMPNRITPVSEPNPGITF